MVILLKGIFIISILSIIFFRGNPGPHKIVYADGQTITWTFPEVWIIGVLYGQRQMEYHGTMKFECSTHNLKCDVVFNPDAISLIYSLMGYTAKNTIDYFKGDILKSGKSVGTVLYN